MHYSVGDDIEFKPGLTARITSVSFNQFDFYVENGDWRGTYDIDTCVMELENNTTQEYPLPKILDFDKCAQPVKRIGYPLHTFMLHDKIIMGNAKGIVRIVTPSTITFTVGDSTGAKYSYDFEKCQLYTFSLDIFSTVPPPELDYTSDKEYLIRQNPNNPDKILAEAEVERQKYWKEHTERNSIPKMTIRHDAGAAMKVVNNRPKFNAFATNDFLKMSEMDLGLIKRTDIEGEIYLKQTNPTNFNPELKFGPLTTRLNDLMNDGFFLEVLGYKGTDGLDRRETLYLSRKGERYKICRKHMSDFLKCKDLTQLVRSQNLTHKLNLNVEYTEIPRKIVYRDVIVNKEMTTNEAWAVLRKTYPRKQKPVKMIGNQTLKEFVRHTLETMVEE